MALKSEREIAVDNGIRVTHYSHLEKVLDRQKMIKHILNFWNISSFAADTTYRWEIEASMRNLSFFID